MTGVFASRNFDAITGATRSYVWYSSTRSTRSFNQQIGIAQRLPRRVAVVYGDQVHMLPRCRILHALHHRPAELKVSLRRKADPQRPCRYRTKAVAVHA